jgi:hypothetical protein
LEKVVDENDPIKRDGVQMTEAEQKAFHAKNARKRKNAV